MGLRWAGVGAAGEGALVDVAAAVQAARTTWRDDGCYPPCSQMLTQRWGIPCLEALRHRLTLWMPLGAQRYTYGGDLINPPI